MRAMKNSGIAWIGEIPQEWDLRKIKFSFGIVAGATPKSGEANYWDGDIPWVTPADYTTEDVLISAGRKSITPEGMGSCATSLVPAGSLVFSKRAPVGLVAISSNPLCTNQGCLSCVPKEKVDAKYYYYVMSIYSEQFDLFASGTTFKEISADAFANFKLPYPIFETQKKIAAYLDAKCAEIDALIAAKEKTNALLKERRQSIIYEAVTKGLDPSVPMKDSGVEWIGEIPEGWSVRRLKTLASFQTGSTPSTSNPEYFEGNINWFTPGDFGDSFYLTKSERTLSQATIDNGIISLYDNESILLVAIGATVGKIGLLKIPAYSNQQITAITLHEQTRAEYYAYWLQAAASSIKATANYTTLPIINNAHLGETLCPFVDDELVQAEIASYLRRQCAQIDSLILKNSDGIRKLKEYRQSLVFEAVTGKIELLKQ